MVQILEYGYTFNRHSADKCFSCPLIQMCIYKIGLGMCTYMKDKHVVVQVSAINSRETRFVDLRSLTMALENDPYLVAISTDILPCIIQTIYVCTGCDYISFLARLGKQHFYDTSSNNLSQVEILKAHRLMQNWWKTPLKQDIRHSFV